jgi:hypothetical protein
VTRTWMLVIAWLAIAVAILAARPRPTPGPFLRDFEAYWSAGATWNAHADPYGRAIWSAQRTVPGVDARRDEILPFVNPPSTLAAWTLLARLPYDVAARLWATILAASLLALVATVLYATRVTLGARVFFAALALAIGFGPITSDLALGQLALPAFLGAVLVAVTGMRSLPAATASACIAFAQPDLALGLVSQVARRRVGVALLLAAAITYALGCVFAGPAWPIWYPFSVIHAHSAAERFSTIQLTALSIARAFGATPRTAQLIDAGIAALAVVGAVGLARRVDDPFGRFAGFSALVPFVAGFFHEHDLVVAYPAAVWCALRTRGPARAIALVGVLLVAVDWLGLAQRPTGAVQSALLACATCAAFTTLGDKIHLRGPLAVLPPFAALFAGAVWLALRNPAPVWPDALGTFHASAGASIASVWAAELRASGLLATIPVWAALRSLSLLGCALLAYAIYRRSSYCRTA